MTGGHGKQQQEGFSKADNRSEVTKLNHLPASYVHTLSCCKSDAQDRLDDVFELIFCIRICLFCSKTHSWLCVRRKI